MRTARNLALVLCVSLCGASPLLAADTPDDVKEAIAYFDKYAPKAKDAGKFADLVHELATAQHPASAERIGKVLMTEKDMERQLIAADALGDLGKDADTRTAAGKALLQGMEKFDDEDLRISIVDSLGRLKLTAATLPICEVLLKSDSPWLMLRCVRSLGLIKDLHALPALLEILERFPVGYKWPAGEEVNYDSGASGDADQKEAERQYNEQNSGGRRKGAKPPIMFKTYIQELKKTVQAITEDPTIDGGQALRKWMVDRTDMLKKLGIEIPKYKGPPIPDEDKKKK